MFNLILVGPPGSGKGTQADRLIQLYNFIPISLGSLLRKQMTENNTNKVLIVKYINSGQLVPDDLSLHLVTELVKAQSTNASLLFDGFPRTISQAIFLDKFLLECHSEIDGVVFLDVALEHLLKRLKIRAMIEARTDDQDEVKIKTRMDIYTQETLPIVNHYRAQGKLHRVDGEQSVDIVTNAIQMIIDRFKK